MEYPEVKEIFTLAQQLDYSDINSESSSSILSSSRRKPFQFSLSILSFLLVVTKAESNC